MNNKLNEKEINSNNKENIYIDEGISNNDINVNYLNKDIHIFQVNKLHGKISIQGRLEFAFF